MPGDKSSERSPRRLKHELVGALADAASAHDASQKMLELMARSGEWALAFLWVADGNLMRVAESWSEGDPAVEEFALVTSRLTFSAGVGLPGRVWETRSPLWVSDVVIEPDFPRAALAKGAGLHGWAGVPLDASGSVFGAVELYAHDVRPVDEERLGELELAGRQMGHYLDRVSVEQRLRESEERTGEITRAALDGIVTMDHDGRIVDANPAAEAIFGFARAEVVGRELAGLIIPPDLREAHRAALARYIETGTPTIIGSRLEVDAQRADGSAVAIELTVTRLGRQEPPLFAGFVRDITERRRDEAARAELLELERAARLRAEQAERQARQIADVLQRSLLPPRLPEIAGFELGAAYRPGVAELQVGGDFYDLFELPGGDWGLIIGDVRGKGVEAASITTLVRYTARAAAVRAGSPSAVLETVNRVMLSDSSDEELCTAIYGRLESGGRICLSIGGHPPPVLLRADGRAEFTGTAGTLLGVQEDASLTDSELVLGPGDALVMVTDGIEESPTAEGRLGAQGLLELVRSCSGLDAAAIAARIDEAVAVEPAGVDDVAVLVVRAAPAA